MRVRFFKLSKTGFGDKLYYYNSVGSTNTIAFELAQKGEPEGTVIIAKTQTQGRGRGGLNWHSPAGGIWMSLILRPQLTLEALLPLGLAIIVALARAVEKVTDLKTLIKWPNDLIINNKKVVGVLLESRSSTDRPEFVILGIGLNVNQTVFPVELGGTATSLLIEKKEKVSRGQIVLTLFQELDTVYPTFLKNGLSSFLAEINDRFSLRNKTVRVESAGEIIEGIALEIISDGSLPIKKDDGSVIPVLFGSIL